MPRRTKNTAFYSTYYVLGALASAVLLFIGVQFVTYMQFKHGSEVSTQVPAPRIDFGQQLQAAQNRGEAYLVGDLPNMQPSDQLFLDYLQRTYQAPAAFSVRQTPIVASKEQTISAAEMKAVMKMAYPTQKLSQLPAGSSLLAHAMQCDGVALPADYGKQLTEMVQGGGYQTTHAAIAIKITNELGCKTNVATASLIERSLNECQKIAATGSNIPDLRYEAMAVLALYGKTDMIQDDWTARLLREQNQDGGWPYGYDTSASKHHSAMLALWVLYALQNPTPQTNRIMSQS